MHCLTNIWAGMQQSVINDATMHHTSAFRPQMTPESVKTRYLIKSYR